VINPNTTMMSSNNLFGYAGGMDGAAPFTALYPAGKNGTISPSGGKPNLSTMGQLASTVALSGTNYLFPQNGWFKWRTYYPIGELAGTIKTQSDAFLNLNNYETYWRINW